MAAFFYSPFHPALDSFSLTLFEISQAREIKDPALDEMFQSFGERISSVNVDVFHRVGHEYENPEEGEDAPSFFHQRLVKWDDLNHSESYRKLRKELPENTKSPADILAQKDQIINVLLDNLKNPDQYSLQTSLELVVALAQDLEKEFYPFYFDVYDQLLRLLNCQDADQLEWTFSCLAYLLKFLWRILVKNIGIVFKSLLPLLSNSKPWYINNFAADTFAFVARKVKDKKSFLKLILENVNSCHDDKIAGCGRLLFAMVKGITGQFHSCANPYFPFLFESLADDDLPCEVLFKILAEMLMNINKSVSPKNCELLWTVLLNTLEKFLDRWKAKPTEKNEKNINDLLALILIVLKARDAASVSNPKQLISAVMKLLDAELPTRISRLTSEIASTLLKSQNVQLSQESAVQISTKIFSKFNFELLSNFVKQTLSYVNFEALILPATLSYCEKMVSEVETSVSEVVDLLAEIITFKTPCSKTSQNLREWQIYPLADNRRRSDKQLICNQCTKYLANIESEDEISTNFEKILNALIILPHFGTVSDLSQKMSALLKLNQLILDAFMNMDRTSTETNLELTCKLFHLWTFVLIAVIKVDGAGDKFVQSLPSDNFVDILLKYCREDVCRLAVLRVLDFFIFTASPSAIGSKLCLKIELEVIKHLASSFHEIRLLAATILVSLCTNEEHETASNKRKVYETILKAEQIEISITAYRDKLICLQRLEYSAKLKELLSDNLTAPLNYLFGILFINFKLIWSPVNEIVTVYANTMPVDKFWPIYRSQLQFASELCKNHLLPKQEVDVHFDCSFQKALYSKMNSLEEKPDYFNYRCLLLENLNNFITVRTVKSKEIYELFFVFMESEYYVVNPDIALTWNVKQHNKFLDVETEEETKEKDNRKHPKKGPDFSVELTLSAKKINRLLMAYLKLVCLPRNKKLAELESKVISIHEDLLMHRSAEIQKLAFDCIVAYKYEYLTPYSENIYRLIDDKTFKSELTSFRIDTNSETVCQEHRPNLIPLILRILYSKMLSTKKVGSHVRRTTILRYLAGCDSKELELFIEMSFKLFMPSIRNYSQVFPMTCTIMSSLNLESTVPPRQLFSSINLAGVILTQSGGLMNEKSLGLLLKVILAIGANMSGIFSRWQNVHSGYHSILNKIKNTAIDLVSVFFRRFEAYNWTVDEINAVFHVFVWPWLRRLPFEGINSPTSLFKLFACWSENPRYFTLLAKPTTKDDVTPLEMLIKLLLNEKTHGSVCNGILEIIEKLLTLSDFQSQRNEDEDDAVISPIPLDFEPKMPESMKLRKKLNLGSCLLYPHLYSILKKLQSRLFISKTKTLSSRDLLILSRVTEIAEGNELANSLLSLIIPVLLNKSTQTEEVVYPLLTTTLNLLKPVKMDKSYLRKLAILFANISHVSCRKMLLTLIKVVNSKLDTENLIDVDILCDLNAYDAKWVEQPDFDKRLGAFKCIEDKIEAGTVSPEFGVILIHNFCFFINHENDMALRDRSSFCVKKLAVMLCSTYKSQDLNFIVSQTIAPIIQKSFKDMKNEKMYTECVSLLGCLVRECPQAHFVFRDFAPLANSADLEVDFFENLLHLQLHRKVRALLKFSEMCNELKSPPHLQTLVSYALPLVSQFLCTPEHLGHNTIIDAAVEALGNICKLLPWQQYYAILQFYLSKLKRLVEFQKQLVKIVKTVLDAFHFDLSRAAEIKRNPNSKTSNKTKTLNRLGKPGTGSTSEESEKGALHDSDIIDSEMIEETENAKVKENEEEVKSNNDDDDDDEDGGDDEEEDKGNEAKDEDLEKLEKDLAVNVSAEIEETSDRKSTENEPVISCVAILQPVEANKIIHTIVSSLLPQLRGTISERSPTEKYHKSNRKYAGLEKEEEDILRIPLAQAIVQLLQKLPNRLLKANISGIFMNLCMFLTSRLESVRRVTRQTLQQIVLTLGPAYLETLITEMITLLTKGFHVYVLVHTLHSVLVAIQPLLKVGDIDRCLPLILKVCVEDVFGSIAEGKESSQIQGKWVEARGNRSYDVFHILGEYVSQKYLLNLILPLKEELASSFSHQKIFRVQECLRYIVLGLVNNQFLTTESMLVFAYGVTSQSIPALLKGLEPETNQDEKEKILAERRNPDCFIIPPAPKERPKVEAHIYAKTNAHILVEFGLRLYHFLLKKEKVKDACFHPHLDPLVTILSDSLKSGKVRLIILTCNCLCWMLKIDLPAMRLNISTITQQLFDLLHKYAAAGLSKGDNFELVQVSFKAMSVLVRDVKYHSITKDQLRTLLLYAEQDLYDYSRQATAFTLLKVIIGKKLTAPEIHAVMEKVASLSITADLPHVRLQARQVFHSFLMNYPQRNKIEQHLTFYLKQLDYEHQTGRESALEMMNVIITTFPEVMLANYSGLFFLWLGPLLVNDPVPECRKMAAACIARLLSRSDKDHVDKLFDMVLVWMKHPKTVYRRLSAQLCGIFIKHEKSEFKSRIRTLLPVICSHLVDNFNDNQPGRFVRLQKPDDEESSESGELIKDHHLYQLLHMLVKLYAECPDLLSDEEFKEPLQAISAKAQELLGHPHEWVRLGATELLYSMMSATVPADIAALANIPAAELEYSPGFLRSNVRETLKSLILDHLDQLMPGAKILDKLLVQTMKNLVYLAEIIKNVKEIEGEVKVSLIWLVRKLRQRINMELARAPLSTTIRTMTFNWFAALALKFTKEELRPIIFHALAPIVRELTTTEAHLEELRAIAKEVSGYYKQKFGPQEYSQLVQKVQSRLDTKRAERKKSRAQEVIKNPEKAAKRKIQKQVRNKDQKKRKIEQLRSGERKRKIQSVEFND